VRREHVLALVTALVAAVYLVGTWAEQARLTTGGISYDLYQHFYPNMVYLVASLRDAIGGVLWNPYQECGKAWLAVSSNGALYPLNVVFLVVDTGTGLLVMTVLNSVIAGLGMFFLCRQLGAGVAAALCGALAFELGNIAVWLSTWTPMVGAAYAWAPTIVLCCERIFRRPTAAAAVALGFAGTLAFLPGHPQVLFHVYQLIALRILWELVVHRMERPFVTLACLASGLALPAFLSAVQLVPAIELARLSIREGALTDAQVGLGITWRDLRFAIGWRWQVKNPVQLVPYALVPLSFLRRATRAYALFYALAGALFFVLAFGPRTPLFDVYLALPMSRVFRSPERLLWVTGLCLGVLTALGVDALVERARARPAGLAWRFAPMLATGAVFALYTTLLGRVFPIEWTLGALLLLAPLAAGLGAPRATVALLVIAVCGNLLFATKSLPGVFGRNPITTGLLAHPETLVESAAAVRDVGARMTPQDRVFLVGPRPGFDLMPKLGSMLQVRTIDDYEPQPNRRHAGVFSMMRIGWSVIGVNAVYFGGDRLPEKGFRRRLLDLQAARWVIAYGSADHTEVIQPPLRFDHTDGEVRVYENTAAFPRAFWVPEAKVMRDEEQLTWMAVGPDDIRRVIALAEPPADGFLGEPRPGVEGTVTFETDDPTHLALRVDAPARGFLFVSDSYYPGWRASVDGRATPILLADHAFRAVEVPAGTSLVEMRFRPVSLYAGAAVSAVTLLGMMLVLVVSWRRRGSRRP